jgi:hypothetical protein
MKFYHFPGANPAGVDSTALPAAGKALEIPAAGIVVALTPGLFALKHTGKYIASGTETATSARLYYARGTTAPVLAISQSLSVEAPDDEFIQYDPARDASNAICIKPASGSIAVLLRPVA